MYAAVWRFFGVICFDACLRGVEIQNSIGVAYVDCFYPMKTCEVYEFMNTQVVDIGSTALKPKDKDGPVRKLALPEAYIASCVRDWGSGSWYLGFSIPTFG